MGSVRSRLGWAFDRWLVYATGGWAIADIRTDYGFPGATPFHREERTRTNGWTVGGGIEYAFLNNWSFRAEYRFTDFGKRRFVDTFSNSADENKIQFHAVRGYLSYRFTTW